ncbi:kelch domain-containing protein 4 isoform X1 [Amblyomma americanum]
MGKKDKKKGKGAEKTIAKTEKKAVQKLKKELAAKGEEDIEKMISQFVEEDRKRLAVTEELVGPPSCRSGATLCVHPEKDQLLLFGGEYFNGQKTFMYNELYVYNIKKNNWLLVKTPNLPPPRCAHQAVMVPQGGGQMWLFGGEFASPTRSQFYHYKDLWVYHVVSRSWEHVNAPGGPSSRSGHRMVHVGRQLLLFGGFHESVRDYRYFNDLYLFDLDHRVWTKVECSNSGPSPRSGCQLLPVAEGKVLLYGGYSREKVKKDLDQGKAHTDMFLLQADVHSPGRWKWSTVKQSGCRPSPRSGMSVAVQPQGCRAYFFGGVQDQEEEETLVGHFFNDLLCLDMDRGFWRPVTLRASGEKSDAQLGDGGTKEEGPHEDLHKLHIDEPVVTSDDGVFTVKIGLSKEKTTDAMSQEAATSEAPKESFIPVPRMGSCLAIKHGIFYLYGGMFEDNDRQFTLSDMYALDLHKLDKWKVLVPLDPQMQEWLGSDDSDSESEDMEVDEEGDDESEDGGACASAGS